MTSEQIMITAILLAGDNAYGRRIHEKADELSGKRFGIPIGTVYSLLERLEARGLVTSWLGEPTEQRGGRAKRYFKVTKDGLAELRQTIEIDASITAALTSSGIL